MGVSDGRLGAEELFVVEEVILLLVGEVGFEEVVPVELPPDGVGTEELSTKGMSTAEEIVSATVGVEEAPSRDSVQETRPIARSNAKSRAAVLFMSSTLL